MVLNAYRLGLTLILFAFLGAYAPAHADVEPVKWPIKDEEEGETETKAKDIAPKIPETENAQPDPQATPINTLSAGDILKITVFNDPDMSGEYAVSSNGQITMPLVGAFQAQGRSVDALQKEITETLKSDGILVDPKINIEIATLRPFYILGEVREPGSYASVPDLDVFKAIAIAGGLTPRAVKDRFEIYRGSGESRQTIQANEATLVMPGDSIRVKERFF
ncbi:MAG: polysaccharide biosynthesis/export family protein [Pseudomonadota bacterium]